MIDTSKIVHVCHSQIDVNYSKEPHVLLHYDSFYNPMFFILISYSKNICRESVHSAYISD